MELGKGRIRKVGINNLFHAVHPHHGVIWTDGKAIYLAPLILQENQLQNAPSLKLGEFEYVCSVHWSKQINPEFCYLCVVHQQNVTVWRVSGEQPKLSFKQVRKINVKPIPQGCLWNPVSDLLCLVSKQQCSFYFRHNQDKGSFGFPSLESSQITCGTWSSDGNKLILCVGVVLLIYRWSDVTKSIDKFAATAWKIPGLVGHVISISTVMRDSVVVAAEVPLETLFKQQDVLKMPDVIGETLSKDDIIQPKLSVTSSLFNLQLNQTSQTSSSLSLINLMDGTCDPVCLSTVPLKGVLSPDILFFKKNSQCVVVGSNSQSQLHIFALLEKHLAYCGDIQLEKSQRPKGICSMSSADDHDAALLILVGQRETDEGGFLSPSLESDFKLSLKYIILKSDYENARKKRSRSSEKSRTAFGIVKTESLRGHFLNKDQHFVQRSYSTRDDHLSIVGDIKSQNETKRDVLLLAPNHLKTQEPRREKMVEEIKDSSDGPNTEALEIQSFDFSELKPSFSNSKLLSLYDLRADNTNVSCANKTQLNDTDEIKLIKEDLIQQSSENSIKENYLKINYLFEKETKTDFTYQHTEMKADAVTMPLVNEGNLRKDTNTSLDSTTELQNSNTVNHSCYHKGYAATESVGEKCDLSLVHKDGANFSERNSANDNLLDSKDFKLSENGVIKNYAPEFQHISDFSASLLVHNICKSDQNIIDSGLEDMEQQIKLQNDCLVALHQRLHNIVQNIEESCDVNSKKKQAIDLPDTIEICCEKSLGFEKKIFLLHEGNLHLETVKLAFGLSTVELILGGTSCVLCANADGYIPLKFVPHSQIKITGQAIK